MVADIDSSEDLAEMKRNNLVVFNNEAISQSLQSNKGEEKLKNIYKRKDGRYSGVKTIKGKTYRVYAKTQKECAAKLQKVIKKGEKGFKYPSNFYEFAVYWYDNFKKDNICEISQNNYEWYIMHNLIKIDCDFEDLTVDILQKHINSMPPTRSREYCTMIIKQILKKAYELDLIPKNYGDFISKGKIIRTKKTGFSLEDQKKILNNLGDDDFSLAVYTLLLTGCRPNELKTITKTNIKKNLVLIDGTKTQNAKRWVKISDWLQNKLLEQPNEEIFKRWTYDALKKPFRRLFKNADVKGSIYMLRHTFATNLFYLGVPDKVRQAFMGHSSSVLTNDVYTDYDPTITKNDILNLYKDLYPNF
ncbi:MAG: tyrosine-type recombinase/integrase [Christensenellales bacterium]